jgi:hypothetical protein
MAANHTRFVVVVSLLITGDADRVNLFVDGFVLKLEMSPERTAPAPAGDREVRFVSHRWLGIDVTASGHEIALRYCQSTDD